MPISGMPKDPDMGSSVKDRASEAVAQAKSKVTEFGSAAADKIDQNRGAAASGLENAASTLHQRADQLPGGEKITSLAHSTAEKMQKTADYVRDHDVDSMLSDVTDLVKKNPGPAILVAAAVGFLVGQTFNRNGRN